MREYEESEINPTEPNQIMKATIEGTDLVIRIPMSTPRPSASGKTLVCASTNGNVKTDLLVGGKPLTIGLNAYISK